MVIWKKYLRMALLAVITTLAFVNQAAGQEESETRAFELEPDCLTDFLDEAFLRGDAVVVFAAASLDQVSRQNPNRPRRTPGTPAAISNLSTHPAERLEILAAQGLEAGVAAFPPEDRIIWETASVEMVMPSRRAAATSSAAAGVRTG